MYGYQSSYPEDLQTNMKVKKFEDEFEKYNPNRTPLADDEEEGVLHLAVQPDDPGQTAENLALATLLQNRGVATGVCRDRGGRVHAAASD